MGILSKFIIKEWFRSLWAIAIVLFLLITVGDYVNAFLRGRDLDRATLEYLLKLPGLLDKVFPVASILASLFCINKLKSHSELVAILAAGYSNFKVFALIFLCALSLGVTQFFNLGFFLPYANKVKRVEITKSQHNESKYMARSSIDGGRLWYKTENYFASFSYFDRKNSLLNTLSLYYFQDNKTDHIIEAQSARYLGNQKWALNNVKEYINLQGENNPEILLHEELETTLNETPQDFAQFESDLTTLNIIGLWRFISHLRKTDLNIDEYLLGFYSKFSSAIICVVFALFPILGIFNPNRRGTSFGRSVIVTLIFCLAFWFTNTSVMALGANGTLSPFLATFGIPLFFIMILTFLYHKQKKG